MWTSDRDCHIAVYFQRWAKSKTVQESSEEKQYFVDLQQQKTLINRTASTFLMSAIVSVVF